MEPSGRAVEDVVAQNVSNDQPRPPYSRKAQAPEAAFVRVSKLSKSHAEKEREISCPIFAHEKSHNLSHTCSGLSAQNMSDVRRHLTRPHRGGASHLDFLRRCHICKEDIINERIFNDAHGSNCNNVQVQRRGSEANIIYWVKLYASLYPNETVIPSPYVSSDVPLPSAISIPIITNMRGVQEDRLMQNTPNVETSATPSVVEHDDYMNGSLNSLWAKICEPKEIPQPEKNPEPEENVESEKTHEPPPNAGIGSRIIASDYDPPKTSTSYPQQLASADIHQSYPVVSNGPLHFPPSLVPSNPAYSEGQIDEWLENNPVWNSIGYTARTSVGRSTSRAVDESGGNPIGYTALDRSTNRTVDAHRHEGIIQQVDQLLRTAEGIRVEDKPADGDAPACCDICDATFGGRFKRGNLERHKKSMHYAVMSRCSLCAQTYRRKDALRKHEWKEHRLPESRPTKRRKEVA